MEQDPKRKTLPIPISSPQALANPDTNKLSNLPFSDEET